MSKENSNKPTTNSTPKRTTAFSETNKGVKPAIKPQPIKKK